MDDATRALAARDSSNERAEVKEPIRQAPPGSFASAPERNRAVRGN
jgi:hypothetical protein